MAALVLAGAITLALVCLDAGVGRAQPVETDEILIGDITTTARVGEPALAYAQARDVAAGFIEMSGGVIGSRRLNIVSVDSGGSPEAARKAVEDLKRQGAAFFIGGLLSDVTLAAARAAGDTPFLAIDARLPVAVTSTLPNLYQIGPPAEALGRALAEAAARRSAVRWGIVGQEDYFGRALAHAFWTRLASLRPEVQLVGEHYVPTLSGDVAGAVERMAGASPEGLLIALTAGDLIAFVRQAEGAGLLSGRVLAVPQAGSPEMLGALGGATGQGDWIVTGYPCCEVGGQPHRSFAQSYRNGGPTAGPTLSALYGYTALTVAASVLDRAWSTEPKALAHELASVRLSSPVGPISFSRETRQSSLPMWVGRIEGGQFVDWTAVDPARAGQP
jgi:branched-chain amino acid transport system substrate-binding protein